MGKEILLTGDRPTGNSYVIGAYIGSLKARLEGQEKYDCLIFSADYHSLTTHFKDTGGINRNILDLIRTQISVGIDPEKVTFYRQSRVVETFRLHVLLSMLTPMAELQRQPALKEKIAEGRAMTFGLVGYPVLMASDILIMKSNVVPVGKDQEAHVEMASYLASRFNSLYGKVLKEPKKLIGEVLVGLDGKGKSGKSTGGIFFNDSTEDVKKKVMSMYTDPNRIRPTDPGKVEGNPVFIYHDHFNRNLDEVEDLKNRYREGKVGDVEVKEKLFVAIEKFLEPIREKRLEIDKLGDSYIIDILEKGEKRVNKIAEETMSEVIKAMGI
jgi:tryptophanyl-tRNA synthetase